MTKREEQARDYAREQAESSSYRVSKINVRDWMFGKGDFSPEAQKLACERTGRRIAKLYQDALLKAMEEEFAIPAEKLAALMPAPSVEGAPAAATDAPEQIATARTHDADDGPGGPEQRPKLVAGVFARGGLWRLRRWLLLDGRDVGLDRDPFGAGGNRGTAQGF